MKQIIVCMAVALLFGCSKDRNEPARILVGLTFTEADTPATASRESGIVSDVKCFGNDLCYQFVGFDIIESGIRQVDIQAVASYPTGNDVVCAQALYQVDTTVRINPLTTGQYVLRFYNGNTLFDADTVQVTQ